MDFVAARENMISANSVRTKSPTGAYWLRWEVFHERGLFRQVRKNSHMLMWIFRALPVDA